MSKNDVNFTPLIDPLIDALAEQMRVSGAASAELSADIPTLGVRVTVKVKEIS